MLRRILVISVLAAPVPAHAENAVATLDSGPRKLVISTSPGRAFMPVLELGAELNLNDQMGVAAIVAGGFFRELDTRTPEGDFERETRRCLQAAVQFRYYLFGDFDKGMIVGAEAFSSFVRRDVENSIRPYHEGVWAGPMVGYKYTFRSGLMLSAVFSLGVALYRPPGLSEDEVPGDVDVHNNWLMPWPNVNLGWAF